MIYKIWKKTQTANNWNQRDVDGFGIVLRVQQQKNAISHAIWLKLKIFRVFFFTLHWPKNQLWNKTLNDIFFRCYFSTPAESHPSSCISKIFKRKICIFANDGFICLICILKLLRKMHAWRLGETRGGQRGSIFKCFFSKWKTLWYYKNK